MRHSRGCTCLRGRSGFTTGRPRNPLPDVTPPARPVDRDRASCNLEGGALSSSGLPQILQLEMSSEARMKIKESLKIPIAGDEMDHFARGSRPLNRGPQVHCVPGPKVAAFLRHLRNKHQGVLDVLRSCLKYPNASARDGFQQSRLTRPRPGSPISCLGRVTPKGMYAVEGLYNSQLSDTALSRRICKKSTHLRPTNLCLRSRSPSGGF
jgi:hypothetical protein